MDLVEFGVLQLMAACDRALFFFIQHLFTLPSTIRLKRIQGSKDEDPIISFHFTQTNNIVQYLGEKIEWL